MFPIIIIEIEDHGEQGYMKHIFISIVLLFSLTIFAEPVADANVNVNMVPKWNYKTIAMEAAKQRECLARNIYFEARNEQFAARLTILDNIKDKEQYAKDLIVKMNLKYMENEVKKRKKMYKETQDTKHLESVETMVKNINKLKLKVRNGKSYSSTL